MGDEPAGAGPGGLELALGAVRRRDRADALPNAPNEWRNRSGFERDFGARGWQCAAFDERGFRDDAGSFLAQPGDKSELSDWLAGAGAQGTTRFPDQTGAGRPGTGLQSLDLLGRRLRC